MTNARSVPTSTVFCAADDLLPYRQTNAARTVTDA